ncbi:DUF924 family protein [Burkholderia orbicola]|uniref:DUF924 family protein n=1 Tax=Burkholderia orbicola TaxID=2978683 RepID=UPI003AF5E33E
MHAFAEMTHSTGEVIAFWNDAGPERWFARDSEFDHRFRERFLDMHLAAAGRQLDDWLDTPHATLALLLLTDQFPRNAFRDTGHMYATRQASRSFPPCGRKREHPV